LHARSFAMPYLLNPRPEGARQLRPSTEPALRLRLPDAQGRGSVPGATAADDRERGHRRRANSPAVAMLLWIKGQPRRLDRSQARGK